MKIEEYYLRPQEKKSNSPIHIDVSGLKLLRTLPGSETPEAITIKCRTWKEKGSEIRIFHGDNKVDRYTYTREMFPNYSVEMACDIFASISSVFKKDKDFKLEVDKLFAVTPLIMAKCEFHQGRRIQNYEYEVLVTFY